MPNEYQRGDLLPLTFRLNNAGANVDLRVRQWSFDEEGLIFDVTNTTHGGRTARIAGKGDHKGTALICFDLTLPPYGASPGIRFGTSGVFRHKISATTGAAGDIFIRIPAIITKVHYESAVDQELRWSVDWAENFIVETTGVSPVYGATS